MQRIGRDEMPIPMQCTVNYTENIATNRPLRNRAAFVLVLPAGIECAPKVSAPTPHKSTLISTNHKSEAPADIRTLHTNLHIDMQRHRATLARDTTVAELVDAPSLGLGGIECAVRVRLPSVVILILNRCGNMHMALRPF